MISYGINSFFGEIDYFYLFIPEIEPVEIGTHFVNRKYFQPSLLVIESFHKARKKPPTSTLFTMSQDLLSLFRFSREFRRAELIVKQISLL